MEIQDEASVKEVLKEIEQFCEKGWTEFPTELNYKGEGYYICTGDCQSCGVQGLIHFLNAMLEDKKIVKKEAPYYNGSWRDPFG